ncbi:hypothetical protein KFV02_10255 [Desulfohalobiaceae bacterium Ax17]|uniref:hypothetical protein n=1 Tax=Desulfovulcanus ferrireducens TaxID=2831190 RepID=UPI00207BBE64|nr:hypothetical protein [Desulfovulcanus ferrireducens]MBT8764315.1 hypothetical protein [Desulfovulcanus ferrireducens]
MTRKQLLIMAMLLALVLPANLMAKGQGRGQGQVTQNAPVPLCPGWHATQQVITISGEVTSFTPPVAVLKTQEGEVSLRLGPIWFWQQKGYVLKPGEKVDVQGYKFNNLLIPVKIKTAQQEIVLRDQYGFPVWRGGRGARGGCCWGNAQGNASRQFGPGHMGYGRGKGMGPSGWQQQQ